MHWQQLLSTQRIGRTEPRRADDHRSPYEIDVDRFVFSSAFRRLQAKMQVHGPSLRSDHPGDYVRTRLTHSLEVSRVGRSLGQLAGHYLGKRGLLPEGVGAADIGHIVSGAAIAHDVGQTPFSHEGEHAISAWWQHSPLAREILSGLDISMTHELTRFEGNAFGFRLLTRLEGWQPNGGLQLTSATLAAYTKYPWWGGIAPELSPRSYKYGFFATECDLFRAVATATGLIEHAPSIWCRHPLAYLTEAADDICYLIVDIEDAVQMLSLPFAEGEALLAPLAKLEPEIYRYLDGVERKLTYLRARAIATLIESTTKIWQDVHDSLLTGAAVKPLLSLIAEKTTVDHIRDVSRHKIYRGEGRTETVLIANRALTTLLDAYAGMLLRRENTDEDQNLTLHDQAILSVMMRTRQGLPPISRMRVEWVRDMMDHIACLTDHGTIAEARLLQGGLGA